MQMPHIPTDAPFSTDQRVWLAGFLAGVQSIQAVAGMPGAVTAGAAQVDARPIHILYGTQTGNSEEVANDAAELARAKGFAPRVEEMDAIDMDQLAAIEHAIFVVSTYGEGEMPDNAHIFWEALSASTAPRLEALNYGVLALGDTSYELFCQAGKVIDTRLEQLGAKRLTARVDCDVDFEDAAGAWLEEAIPDAGPGSTADAGTDAAPARKKSKWGRKNPYPSRVVDNRILSGPDSAKEIRHIAFDLGESGLTYEAGDALGVMPVNGPDLVNAFLSRLDADADTAIADHDEPLGDLLRTRFEIMTPSKDLIAAVEARAGDDELSHVLVNGDKEALDAFLWGKDALDLLNLNSSLQFDVQDFVSWLKPLQHRAYSISSSPKAHEGEVHLTVAAVRWVETGREHKGVCSTFLADQVPEGAEAGIFMSPNKSFRVPEDDTVPMVMVGPGTGIAPFRAFLEERRERQASGTNWLFFGDQRRVCDFIYQDELAEMSTSGLLNRLDLAFSRDQTQKIYVQNRMTENGRDLFAALEDGGHFYVCGDATRMAKDVDATLHTIIETQGSMTPEAAIDYVNRLKREKRYVRDVY